MPPLPSEKLRKVTLNLYDKDVEALAKYFGHGWSEHVRDWVRQHTYGLTGYHKLRKTLGDFE